MLRITHVLVHFFTLFIKDVLRPSSGHSQRDSLTNLMLIIAFVQIRPEGHQEPCNKVGPLSPAKHLAGFELGTFRFWLQHLNPLGRSPHNTTFLFWLAPSLQKMHRYTKFQIKLVIGVNRGFLGYVIKY